MHRKVQLIVSGGIRNGADVAKALALGADAVSIGTAALVALGDATRVATLLPVLRSYGQQMVVLWPGVVILGPAQLYLGGALAVLGETEEARQVLTAALAQAESLGARPFADRARALLATLED
jgi:hypothetical protein